MIMMLASIRSKWLGPFEVGLQASHAACCQRIFLFACVLAAQPLLGGCLNLCQAASIFARLLRLEAHDVEGEPFALEPVANLVRQDDLRAQFPVRDAPAQMFFGEHCGCKYASAF